MFFYAICFNYFFCLWWLRSVIACSLQKGTNCIFIDNDPLQCNQIKQRINVIQVLPDELQEVGLKKGEFSGTLVVNMSKEPQPPLGGMFGKEHFGHLAYIKGPMKMTLMSMRKDKLQKSPVSMKNLACMILLISLMSRRKC